MASGSGSRPPPHRLAAVRSLGSFYAIGGHTRRGAGRGGAAGLLPEGRPGPSARGEGLRKNVFFFSAFNHWSPGAQVAVAPLQHPSVADSLSLGW